MDYKSLMGYGKKKTPTKEKQLKPKKNQILEGIKKDLNEWNDETFKTLPKRWSGASDKGLTEFEKQGGKDNLNEVDFKIMLKADRMASEKLQEGIINFSKAIEQLEIQLKERLCSIESDTEAVLSSR